MVAYGRRCRNARKARPDAAGALTRVTSPLKNRSSVLAMRSAPRWTCWLLRRGRSCGGSPAVKSATPQTCSCSTAVSAWRSPLAQAARKVWEILCSSWSAISPLGGMAAARYLGASPLGQLTAGRRRLAKDLCDLVEGELEDIVQYEGDAFGRAEPLQQDQQGFANFLVQSRPARGIDHRLLAQSERTVQPCGNLVSPVRPRMILQCLIIFWDDRYLR